MTTDAAAPSAARAALPLRVCFVVRSLDTGGAERQLVELVRGMPPAEFDWTVLTFYGGGALERELDGLPNARVRCLGKSGRWDTAGFLVRLVREVRRARPDVVHGSQGVANEAALLAGRLLRRPVIWRLGASDMDFTLYDWSLAAIFRMGARLSPFPDAIVVNSCAGFAFHVAQGWSDRRMTVVPNGFDTERFTRTLDGRRRLRAEWGIPEDAVLVGLVARLDPIKDHETFLVAATELADRCPTMRFVCIGDGVPAFRNGLQQRAEELGLGDRLIWAGECARMVDAYSSLDIACLTSISEGLPNVIGEAMSCEVSCVVTDVGDCARVVGDTGIVVPRQSPSAFADAILGLAAAPASERLALGRRARARIVERFSRNTYVAAMSDLLRGAATARRRPNEFAATRERLLAAACHRSTPRAPV
ncbi:glycosyl transferase [Luteitalea sp. TBR-22]|uniref:glycosyltransferase n=1 Tax=Luteitalea sp. TBR-22 TaxID=2802971 RepID=UPI001AF5CBEF|nr:glycosyltransferase [Luteitalea sp. TBR-22]BCS34694.1 glycosyl transferase [Luteitalea sp. TBR-22]